MRCSNTLGFLVQFIHIMRISMASFLMVTGIASCLSLKAGMCFGACLALFLSVFGTFMMAWTIVGAVMFWGKVNPTGVCEGGVQIYLFINLILSFVTACCKYCASAFKKSSN